MLGTSPIGIAAQLGLPFLVLFLEGKGKWAKLKEGWKRGARHGIYALLIIWVFTFGASTILTVFEDHAQLVIRNEALASENSILRSRIRDLQNRLNANQNGRDKSKREAIQERLGKFILEGREIQQDCTTALRCDGPREKWEKRLEKYLRANLNSSYADRFAAGVTHFGVPYEDFGQDLSMLNEFIKELAPR